MWSTPEFYFALKILGETGMQRLDIRRPKEDNASATELRSPLGFNWGAFCLTWIWAIGNRTFNKLTLLLLILCAVPYVGPISAIGLMFYSGVTGSDRAWKSKKWHDSEHFRRVQRRWAIVGVAQFVLALLFMVGVPFFVAK